jgi:hypothetical protein
MGAVSTPGQSGPQGFDERTLRVSFPEEGLRFDNLVLRLPGYKDLQGLAAAFADGELNGRTTFLPLAGTRLRSDSETRRRSPGSSLPTLRPATFLAVGPFTTLTRSAVSSRSAIGSIRGHAVAESQRKSRGRSRSMRSRSVSTV